MPHVYVEILDEARNILVNNIFRWLNKGVGIDALANSKERIVNGKNKGWYIWIKMIKKIRADI